MALNFLPEKFHLVLTRYWWVITYFFFSSHEHVQHMTSQILLILIDFDWVFDHFLIWNYSSLNRYNSRTRRDIKKR